jgi:hypothetical protein
MKESIKALRQAVEGLHNCKATYKEKNHIKETFDGHPVWEGDVYIFELKNHPTAILACAWSSPVEGSDKRRFYAVLHSKPAESAQDAVRAAIVNDYKGG